MRKVLVSTLIFMLVVAVSIQSSNAIIICLSAPACGGGGPGGNDPPQPYSASNSYTECFNTLKVYIVFNTATGTVDLSTTFGGAQAGSIYVACVGFITCQNFTVTV